MSFESIPLSGQGPELTTSLQEYERGLHLFVSHPRVVDLPEEGTVTFCFKRGPITLREGREEEGGTASVDLCLTEICDCEAGEVEESESEAKSSENAIDAIFASLQKKQPEEPEEDEEE